MRDCCIIHACKLVASSTELLRKTAVVKTGMLHSWMSPQMSRRWSDKRHPPAEKAGVGSWQTRHQQQHNGHGIGGDDPGSVYVTCGGEWESAAASRQTPWRRTLIRSTDSWLRYCTVYCMRHTLISRKIPVQDFFLPGTGKNFRDPGNSGPVNIPSAHPGCVQGQGHGHMTYMIASSSTLMAASWPNFRNLPFPLSVFFHFPIPKWLAVS